MSGAPPSLVSAYRAAWYRIALPDGCETIRVGEAVPPRVGRWIAGRGKPGAALVTACNPRGRLAAPEENAAAMERLKALVCARGWPSLPGAGGDDRGAWPEEPSLLVALDSRAQAERVGRAFRQNAILWLPAAGVVDLVWVADAQAGCQ